VFGEA